MSVGAWLMLTLYLAGIFGGLACFVVLAIRRDRADSPAQPVWVVLLAGGKDGRDETDIRDGERCKLRPQRSSMNPAQGPEDRQK